MGYAIAGTALLAFVGIVLWLRSRRAGRDPRGGPGRYPRDSDPGPGRRE